MRAYLPRESHVSWFPDVRGHNNVPAVPHLWYDADVRRGTDVFRHRHV